jgi:hypothetical protein
MRKWCQYRQMQHNQRRKPAKGLKQSTSPNYLSQIWWELRYKLSKFIVLMMLWVETLKRSTVT